MHVVTGLLRGIPRWLDHHDSAIFESLRRVPPLCMPWSSSAPWFSRDLLCMPWRVCAPSFLRNLLCMSWRVCVPWFSRIVKKCQIWYLVPNCIEWTKYFVLVTTSKFTRKTLCWVARLCMSWRPSAPWIFRNLLCMSRRVCAPWFSREVENREIWYFVSNCIEWTL